MLTTLVAFAMLAGSDGVSAVKPRKVAWDPNRMVCKYDLQPGSRLARRKVCLTESQWAEWKRIEQANLLRNQYNGAP